MPMCTHHALAAELQGSQVDPVDQVDQVDIGGQITLPSRGQRHRCFAIAATFCAYVSRNMLLC